MREEERVVMAFENSYRVIILNYDWEDIMLTDGDYQKLKT